MARVNPRWPPGKMPPSIPRGKRVRNRLKTKVDIVSCRVLRFRSARTRQSFLLKKAPIAGGFFKAKEEPVLKFANVLRRRALGAGNDIEAHPITFGQGLEAFSLNRGMVDEKILATFLLNKAEPL
jgi:hypothetical protein